MPGALCRDHIDRLHLKPDAIPYRLLREGADGGVREMRREREGHPVPAAVIVTQIDDQSARAREILQDAGECLSGCKYVGVPPSTSDRLSQDIREM